MPSSSASIWSTRSACATSTSPTSRTSIISPATSISTDQSFESPPWILQHILETNTAGELPLVIMFAINSGQAIPRLKEIYSWWQLDQQGKLILEFLSLQARISPSISDATLEDIRAPALAAVEPDFDPLHCPDDRFMDRGNEKLLKIGFAHLIDNAAKQNIEFNPHNRKALPAHFVRKYCLDRVFVSELKDVNFDHALTALDYLRDLENTRRNVLREAAQELGINGHNWRRVLWCNSIALKWVEETQGNELRIETMYANLFLDLRIWTMTSVLLADDFNKGAALAMLNTLFPPAVQDLPNSTINPKILYEQRAIFYRFTIDVERNGPGVVIDYKEKLSQPDNRHQWPVTRGTLERYTILAEKMIEQANYATSTLRLPSHESLNYPNSVVARGFTASSFEAFDSPRTAPKTPKPKTSMSNIGAMFGLVKKTSQIFGGQKDDVYSKSMVNVSGQKENVFSKSMVNVSRPTDETILKSTPEEDRGRNQQPRKAEPIVDTQMESWGRYPRIRTADKRDTSPRYVGLSRTTPAPTQPKFDNLETPGSTRKVSFDFDAALGLRCDSGRPSFLSDAKTPIRSRNPKPNLQVDTETITCQHPAVSPLQSARAFLKTPEPTTPTDFGPQTADNPTFGRHGLRTRGSSKKLYSGFETRQTERFPSLATLPIKRREVIEPAMVPEPLNINRPRKPVTPGTSNLSSFPPRIHNKDRDSPAQSSATKSITFADFPNIINSPSQENDESLTVKKVISNVSATASRPSSNSDASLRPIQKTSTGASSASRRLPSDNLHFLSRPYTGSSSDMEYLSPVIMKKTSMSDFFTGRRKKSTPALADEFSRSDGLGISTQSVQAIDENEAASKQVKKKNSMGAFIHGKSKQKEKSSDHEQHTGPIAQESVKIASASTSVIKKKSSVSALINNLSGNKKGSEDQRADSTPQKSVESPCITGILKNKESVSAFKNGNPTNMAATQKQDEVPTKTPTSARSARFEDNLTTSTSHNSAGSENKEKPEEGAKLKNKKSHNFFKRLRSSESKATLHPNREEEDEMDWPPPNTVPSSLYGPFDRSTPITTTSRKLSLAFLNPPGLHYSTKTPPQVNSTPPQISDDFVASTARSTPQTLDNFAAPLARYAPQASDNFAALSARFAPRTSDNFNATSARSTPQTSDNFNAPLARFAPQASAPGPSMPRHAEDADIGVFAQWKAEQAARRAAKSGGDRNGISLRDFLDSGEGAPSGAPSGAPPPRAASGPAAGAYTMWDFGDEKEEKEEKDEEGFGRVGGAGVGGGAGGSQALKKKKSFWGGFGKREKSGEEKGEKERKKREKVEKKAREVEEGAAAVLEFAG